MIDPINVQILANSIFSGHDLTVTTTLPDPSAQFSASLRAIVLVGVSVNEDLLDIHADFDVGVFADLPTYQANVTSSDSFVLGSGTLPSATATASAPYPTSNGTAPAPSCTNVLTESLSVDLGISEVATTDVTMLILTLPDFPRSTCLLSTFPQYVFKQCTILCETFGLAMTLEVRLHG